MPSMIRISTILSATIVFVCSLTPLSAQAGPLPAAGRSITVLPSTGPRTLGAHRIITFRVRVKGIQLDARHIGKAPISGRGHIQVYLDRVPADAYRRKDLSHWLAAVASTTFTLNLNRNVVPGHGTHRIFLALAKNNYVLYQVKPAAVTITVK